MVFSKYIDYNKLSFIKKQLVNKKNLNVFTYLLFI